MAGGQDLTLRRRINWRWLGLALSAGILCWSLFTLYHLLGDLQLAKVFAAVRNMPTDSIVLAAVLVFASYVTITFYDFFALRTIGRGDVPYRVAAATNFMSYTIGHNLGATVLTGGAVRYRIYAAWGLTLIDVAKIAFITGLTFWLGNSVVLGLAVAWAPEAASAVNQLPSWTNRTAACALLAAVVAYLLWLMPRPRSLGHNGWRVTLPNARLTLLQIGIGVLDLLLAALAMYVLLPAGRPDVATVIVTFVLATLMGFISHTPGGIGVFDAIMLLGLSAMGKEELLASLLVFRGLYFVLPFLIAIGMMAVRELRLALQRRDG